MAHARIAKILSVQRIKGVWITTIEDSDGNLATGVGNDYRVDEPVLTFFHDRFNRPKFYRPGKST